MMYEQIDSISRERNSKMESEILELKNNRIEKLTRAFSQQILASRRVSEREDQPVKLSIPRKGKEKE